MNFLIVGGSSAIGSKLSETLKKEGHEVVSTYRSQAQVDSDEGSLLFEAEKHQELPMDQLELDGIAYLPGTINLKPFHRLTQQEFLQDLQINFLGAVHVIQQAIPVFKQRGGGSIVLFSSVAVSKGMPFHSSIAAAKGALEGMARSLAAELAPHIRINVIAPSLVETPLSSRLLSSEQRRTNSDNLHPLKRVGQANDIAAMAAFLLTQKSAWITGQVIGVDGGISTLQV
jgi:NAD(P)-dependent dehydrogenase (short-subunit alcohol dehydrogenase family)